MKRLGDTVRAIGEPGDGGKGDDVAIIEQAAHRPPGRLVGLGGHLRHRLGPADDRLFPLVEQVAFTPSVAREQFDVLVRVTQSPTELFVVRVSVAASVDGARLDDHQLLELDELDLARF
jgi:hypothetical protein